jgi:peptide/nickel transport system substrate-binding protein
MMYRRIPGLALALLLAVGLMAGPALAQKRGGSIVVGNDEDAVGLDPHLSVAFASTQFYELVYNGLLRFSAKGDIEGDLASAWEIPDPTTCVFRLRKGVKFHNGRELTAEDVRYSIDRIRDPKNGSVLRSIYADVERVEATDRYTVRVKLTRPNAAVFSMMATRASFVVPREEVEKHGTLQKVAIGTGPFKLAEHVPGDHARYVRNPDYYESGLPYLDEVVIKVIKDESSRLAALRKGAVDLTWIKDPAVEELARKEKNIVSSETPEARQLFIWLNTKQAPFNNVKLRQAVAAAMNRQEIIDTVLLGRGKLTTLLPPAAVPYVLSQGEMAVLPFYKQDYGLVRKLLAEAGHPNGFEFTYKTSAHSPDYVPAAQVVQRQLAKAGITVKIEQMEWGALLNLARTAGEFQAISFARIWYPDPEGYAYDTLYSKGSFNMGGYNNPDSDRLLEEQRATVDVQKRAGLWKDLQRLWAQDVPIILPYAMRTRFNAWQPHVKGFQPMANSSRIYLRETWLDR